jgi:hypothetical protein
VSPAWIGPLLISAIVIGGVSLAIWMEHREARDDEAARNRHALAHGPRALRRPAPVVLSAAERAAFSVLARSVEGQPWHEVLAAVSADYPPDRPG